MKNKNDDTDILSSLRNKQPTEMQLHKWNASVQYELLKSKPQKSLHYFFHLLASGVCGVIIGAFIFGSQFGGESPESTDYLSADATQEIIYTKLE